MDTKSILNYTYRSLAQEIVCGPEAISGIGESLDRMGASRAMVLCGPSILEGCDVVQRVQDALGERCVGLFSGVAPHSPVEVLRQAVDAARDVNPDALVSVGGGSTHDTAKGVALLLAEGGDAAVMARSVPLEKAWDDAMIAYGQNGEAIRPEQGYPARLLLPGWEGNAQVKWIRRIEISDGPFMTRDETS